MISEYYRGNDELIKNKNHLRLSFILVWNHERLFPISFKSAMISFKKHIKCILLYAPVYSDKLYKPNFFNNLSADTCAGNRKVLIEMYNFIKITNKHELRFFCFNKFSLLKVNDYFVKIFYPWSWTWQNVQKGYKSFHFPPFSEPRLCLNSSRKRCFIFSFSLKSTWISFVKSQIKLIFLFILSSFLWKTSWFSLLKVNDYFVKYFMHAHEHCKKTGNYWNYFVLFLYKNILQCSRSFI